MIVVTVTATATALYTDVRCPDCTLLILAVPGHVIVHARRVSPEQPARGHGAVVLCKRCRTKVEAVVLRAA